MTEHNLWRDFHDAHKKRLMEEHNMCEHDADLYANVYADEAVVAWGKQFKEAAEAAREERG